MRDPLYRAKTRGSNPEWVYGYYCKYGKHIDKIHCVNKDGYAYLQIGIDLVTLGQYTGLTDQNGNQIFDGDIVQGEAEEARGMVEWQQAECCYLVSVRNGYDWLCMDDDKWTVIGNIYDNPELLE